MRSKEPVVPIVLKIENKQTVQYIKTSTYAGFTLAVLHNPGGVRMSIVNF